MRFERRHPWTDSIVWWKERDGVESGFPITDYIVPTVLVVIGVITIWFGWFGLR